MTTSLVRKSVMSSAIALALIGSAVPSYAVMGVKFDASGGGGSGVGVVSFTWEQNSVLAQNAFTNDEGGGVTQAANLMGQGQLQTLVLAAGGSTGNENFTYVFSLPVTATNTGNTDNGTVTFKAAVPPAGFFRLYANGAPLTAAQLDAGTGFDTGILILEGTVILDSNTGQGGSGAASNFQINTTTPAVNMGGTLGTKSQGGNTILTVQGAGAVNLDVNVTFGDTRYFRSNITTLPLDLEFDENVVDPFKTNVRVPDAINSTTPNYGGVVATNLLNNFSCDGAPGSGGTTPCDMIYGAATGNSTVNDTFAPEPASLALLGLGLLGLGGIRRLRKVS